MLNNFEKFSFPSIEKRWTKDKETDGQKEKRQEKKKKEKEKKKKKEKTSLDFNYVKPCLDLVQL